MKLRFITLRNSAIYYNEFVFLKVYILNKNVNFTLFFNEIHKLIKFSENREACISDKYGIAVYQKMIVNDLRHRGQKRESTIDVIKIDTSGINDSVFELPSGVKKIDMDTMLKNMSNMWR